MSISLDILQEKISDVSSPTALSCSHFLHTLVLNENVTLTNGRVGFLQINPYAAYLCSNRFFSGISYEDGDVHRLRGGK